MMNEQSERHPMRTTCCPCGEHASATAGISRRGFLQGVSGAGALGMALTGLTWSSVAMAAESGSRAGPQRRALVVKPILVYEVPTRRHQTSWRSWGGIETQAQAEQELGRIQGELNEMKQRADFPVEFLKPVGIRSAGDVAKIDDLEKADVAIIYAAGGPMNVFDEIGKRAKNSMIFCRHKSGPVYLWYEIISPRYLRQHTDARKVQGVDDGDVVVDSQDDLLWRLRALCGLQNALGTRIIAVGGPGAWAQPPGVVPDKVREKWKFDIRTLSYDDLGRLMKEARADEAAVKQAQQRASAYLNDATLTLETQRSFVDNAFLLDEVFRAVMKKADCQAITINGCMGTIMPISETTACLPLSLLNDSRYVAFCESDFVVIPSGVLLANISGNPVFLNDPTYPHDGIITLAHCTAPRRMNGKDLEPVRLLTHFESDYGVAPKVEMSKGQVLTIIVPDFELKRWVGLKAEIVDAPFLPICRSQIDVRFTCDSKHLAERMPGFHWMVGYGDYRKEIGYACKKVGIQWEDLTV
ncbi:MAG: twin-arginine translocation signal domain-containing protein [Sedimentisphaerales bacterium]|nr:twin-arginine translocation signal domain-containing protein [Sedimentisphaerales bacterium]